MKLLENMEEFGGTIHDAIQQMVNDMFREELDDDQITEIVNKLSLSDILALDAAYTAGNKDQVQGILGPLPQLAEYNMGGGTATSSASTRPTTAGAAKKKAASASAKPTSTTTATYSGGNQNVAPTIAAIGKSTSAQSDDDEEELQEELDDIGGTTTEEYTEWSLVTTDELKRLGAEELDEADEEETNIVEMTAWLKRRAGIDT